MNSMEECPGIRDLSEMEFVRVASMRPVVLSIASHRKSLASAISF